MWTWIVDKLLGPLIVGVLLAVLAFSVGLVSLPGRVERLERQTDKIPQIFESIGSLKSDEKNFKEASDRALANVNDFNTKLFALGQANAELKGYVDNLKGLSMDIRELRSTIDDLRTTVTMLPEKMKQDAARSLPEPTQEIFTLLFLTPEHLRREGDVFIAQLQYPEHLIRGRPVREIRTRLSGLPRVPGLSSITAFAEPQKGGYNLLLGTQEPDALAAYLSEQPIRIEVLYVVDR